MKTPALWNSRGLLSTVLLPVSWLYALASTFRKSFIIPETVSVPVICVGNLTAGGSGKTPVALYIGERLKQKNIKAFFLSRGYRGDVSGPVLVDPEKHTARDVGDEPLLLANVLPTVVSKDRVRGAYHAISLGAQAIVMDDGLQNPSLRKTLSIMVVDGKIGFGNRRIIPAGPLRESIKSGFRRINAVIVIGGTRIDGIPTEIPVLFVETTPTDSIKQLRGKKVLAFCGIAYPHKFLDLLVRHEVVICDREIFGDHHLYNETDLKKLVERANAQEAILVTTAKDAARLTAAQRMLVNVVDISLQFDNPEELDSLLDYAMKQS